MLNATFDYFVYGLACCEYVADPIDGHYAGCVALCVIGVGVDLEEQAISARCDR